MVSIKNSGGEKWGKSCTHSVRRAHDTTSHHTPQHHPEEALFIAIAAFLRGLGALREQPTPSRGGQWGAGWETPGSGVGNPGERGGKPRGAGWGTPGSGVGSIVEQPRGVGWRTLGSKVEEHRAVHTTPQSKESSGQIRRSISARNRIRRRTKWGAPVSRRAPLSTAVCVRRQSSSLRLSQRRS